MKNEQILDSWKEISDYLGREIRTCHRWEKKLGLPIHRVDSHSPRSKVFAYKSEIDVWLRERASNKTERKFLSKKKRALIGLATLLVLIWVVLGFLMKQKHAVSLLPEDMTIAILPFEDQNLSEYEKYFAEGIASDITDRLIVSGAAIVIPAFSFLRNREIPDDTRQLGRELGAGFILRGRIRKENERFEFYAELICTKTGKHIWGSVFEDNLENILSVQNQICMKITELLNKNAGNRDPVANFPGRADNYEAFETYLKGNFILNELSREDNDEWKLYHRGKLYWNMSNRESNEFAINLFNQAIELDMDFALAYIGLAYCYSNFVNFNWDFDIKWLNKAEDLLRIAQALSPDLPEYYSALIEINLLKGACFNEDTINLAFDLAAEAVEKYPHHHLINSIAGYCYYLKFGEEGKEALLDKALEYKEKSFLLNPYNFYNVTYAEFLMIKKDFLKAINVCNIIEKHDPSLMAKFKLAEIYYFSGELDKSQDLFEILVNSWDFRMSSLYYLGMIASQKHKTEEAVEIARKIISESPDTFEGEIKLASIYFGLGKDDLGYEFLDSFLNKPNVEKRKYIYLRYIDLDRNFEEARGNIRRKYYGKEQDHQSDS